MTGIIYIFFVFVGIVLGGCLGFIGHFLRSNFSGPEKLFDDEDGASDVLNTLMGDRNYMVEKYVVGAKWDDNGFWDQLSNRNLVYMVLISMAPILFLGLVGWPARAEVVAVVCKGLTQIGLHSPLCG